MNNIHLSEEAQNDLVEIKAYIEEELLVSSYGCAAETADIEFAWTRRHAIDKGTNLGRHLIQAFQPGDRKSTRLNSSHRT